MRDALQTLLIGALVNAVLIFASVYLVWRLRMESVWTARCAAGDSHACLLRRTLP